MDKNRSPFNTILLIVLIALYLLSLAAFSYANWAADPAFVKWWMILLNLLILSMPLLLLYGSIYVLGVAWQKHASGSPIGPRLAGFIHWTPRLAAIVIIIFLSLFSLDVFEIQDNVLTLLGAFLIHNLPAIGLLLLLIAAWKKPALGFVSFLLAAALLTVLFVRGLNALPNLLLFVLPVLLVSLLFYADWQWLKPKQGDAQV